MDSKIRSNLRAMAVHIDECIIIGKEGITENVKKQMEDSLLAHELIKIKILESFPMETKLALAEIAKVMRAEPVQAVGRKVVIYRKSYRKDIKHIALK